MLRNLLTNASLPDGYQKIGVDLAALYALIGYLVVFSGIAFLIFVVWLVGRIMTGMKTSDAPKKAPDVVKETVSPSIEKQSDEVDEETMAVIMAALMAYYENNYPKCEFTVKRIKRIRRNDYA